MKKLLLCMTIAALSGGIAAMAGMIALARWAEQVCGDVIETEDGISIDRFGAQLPEEVEL